MWLDMFFSATSLIGHRGEAETAAIKKTLAHTIFKPHFLFTFARKY